MSFVLCVCLVFVSPCDCLAAGRLDIENRLPKMMSAVQRYVSEMNKQASSFSFTACFFFFCEHEPVDCSFCVCVQDALCRSFCFGERGHHHRPCARNKAWAYEHEHGRMNMRAWAYEHEHGRMNMSMGALNT